jgi:hypothetical protein
MLKDGTLYQDLGPDHFDWRSKEAQTQRLVNRPSGLGFAATLEPLPQAA